MDRNLKYLKRLKELREEKNLTQKELSEILQVSRSNIGKYENGQVDLSTELLLRYSEYFGCSVSYILGLSDNKTENISNEYIQIFIEAESRKISPEKIKKFLDLL